MNEHIARRASLWGFILIVLSSIFLLTSAVCQTVIIIEPNAEYKETTYKTLASDQKEIALVTYQTELNKDVLRLRSDSQAPLKEQLNILSSLLNDVLKKEKDQAFKTFFIGRLIMAFGKNNSQMSERLAMAAYDSDLWDNTKGRPMSGHENTFCITLSNQSLIYPELSKVFFKHGYAIQVSGIEKVLIDRVDRLPFSKILKEKGMEDAIRLPFDGMTWFSIKKATQTFNVPLKE
ncbi:MAG: hypothetical protein GY699_13810 [Desulfobacteraceae bacterium]|nr:hypothetical protein [Desulfobacteraceae bacterium]